MVLTPLAAVDRSALRWIREREHPDAFSLMTGDRTVAVLEWAERGASLATLKSAAGEWTMKRGGFLNPHITVRSGEQLQARLSVHFNYHQIDLVGGQTYRFHRPSISQPTFTNTWLKLATR